MTASWASRLAVVTDLRVRVQRQPRRGMPKRILLNLYVYRFQETEGYLNTSVEMCASRFAY